MADTNSKTANGAERLLQSDAAGLSAEPEMPTKEDPALRVAYAIGSIGILAATAADALGVVGRHTGYPLHGSIELVQASVVLLAASAMFAVTVHGGHASVHMVTARLQARTARFFHSTAALLSALAFLLIAIGSSWVAVEMWSGYELTELLHIPIRWLRLVWILFSLLIMAAFLRSAWKGRG